MKDTIIKLTEIIGGFFVAILTTILWFSLVGGYYDNLLQPFEAVQNHDLTTDLVVANMMIYLFISLIVVLFIIPSLEKTQNYLRIGFFAGFLGALIYGIHAFYNYVIFDQWPAKIVALDCLLGFLVFGITTVILKFLNLLLKRF
jgi:uncharacterized membrane protein